MGVKRKENFDFKNSLDERMTEIRKLHKVKETLENELKSLENECEVLSEILLSESVDDLESIDPLVHHKEPELLSDDIAATFKQNCLNSHVLTLYRLMGIEVERRANGAYIIEFFLPKGCEKLTPALVCLQKQGKKLILQSHTLPTAVPIDLLTKKHLGVKDLQTTSFCYEIQESLYYYWSRYLMTVKLKERNYLKGSIIYVSTNITTVSFTLTFQNDENVEYRLRYDPLSVLPYEVTCIEIDQKPIDRELKGHLASLASDLKRISIIDVLDNVIGDVDNVTATQADRSDSTKQLKHGREKTNKSAIESSLYEPTDSSGSSISTIVYDLF